MRLLATRHVFEEVSPDVFRNNRVSARMCTEKPVKEMLEKYEDDHLFYPYFDISVDQMTVGKGPMVRQRVLP